MIRRFFRSLYILRVIFQYGLDELVLSSFENPWLTRLRDVMLFGRKLKEPRGVRLRKAFETLGPIFVKFGQLLSTRRDLLPEDIADELKELQDNVPPFDPLIAQQIIENALRKPICELFESFETKPVASASIAQVHFATLKFDDGQIKDVAIKVLRPNMRTHIEQDLDLMKSVAHWIERLSSDGRRLRSTAVVSEFDKYLHDELDLIREAANAALIRRNMEGLNLLLVPEMYWDYCTSNVIVMERMTGISINKVDELKQAGVDIPKLARDGVTVFFTQVFRDGIFHADMHPGNVMVSVEPQTFGRYIGIDYGIVGTLTQTDKDYLAQNLIAFFRRDYKRVAELHVESGWAPLDTRVDELEAAVRACCEPYFNRPLKEISLGMVLMRLFQTSRRFNIEVQPQLVLLEKTMLNIEGLGRDLDPDLDLWNTARPFLEQWMSEQVGYKAVLRKLKDEMPRYAQYLPELPRLMHQALSQQTQLQQSINAQNEVLGKERKKNKILLYMNGVLLGVILGILMVGVWRYF